jgi:hypothetical protein
LAVQVPVIAYRDEESCRCLCAFFVRRFQMPRLRWKSAEGYEGLLAQALPRRHGHWVASAEKSLMQARTTHMAVIAKGDAVKRDIDRTSRRNRVQQAFGPERNRAAAVQQPAT